MPKKIEIPEFTHMPSTARYQDIRICDGLNQGINPLDIGQGQATSLLNFMATEYPTLTVRKGFTQIGATDGTYTTHLRKYKGDLIKGTKSGVYRLVSGSWSNIVSASAAERYYSMAQYDNDLYMADGNGKVQKYNGSSTSTVSDTPANSRFITLHANRMFLVADDEPNVLRWSKYEDPKIYTTFNADNSDPGFQPINGNAGEDIEAIYTYRDRVLIFKKHSMHALYGERGYDFVINDLSNHVGCIAWRTLCEVNNVLYFLGASGIYAYSGGSVPTRPISDPVKPYIQSINKSEIKQCVAGSDGRRLFLTLVTGASTSPNVTLMYDPDRGPENGWFVMDYKSSAFLFDEESWYTGTIDGKVYQMDSGDTDTGAAIAYEVVTKPITLIDGHRKRQLNKVSVRVDIPEGATMNVYFSPSAAGDDWTLTKALPPTSGAENVTISLVGQRSEWFRLKISGSGRVKIYAVSYML